MGEVEENPSEVRLRAAIEAYHASALAFAAVKQAPLDRRGDRRWSAAQLAADLHLSPPHLFRFLRGLVTLGICAEHNDGTFVLTPLGRSLAAGSPSRLRGEGALGGGANLRPGGRVSPPASASVAGLR